MSSSLPSQGSPDDDSQKLKIYLLPNLFTAGNLFVDSWR